MASWMVHLQVADRLLERLEGITETEFVMGNIAPDSGLPSEDWTFYTPSKELSHFYIDGNNGKKEIGIRNFTQKYFTEELRRGYTAEEASFFLGYLVHLVTDVEWIQRIYGPGMERCSRDGEADKNKHLWAMKADWYDLDFLYLKKHPDFRAFRIYEQTEGFENTYMDIFSREAFDRRRRDIVSFYRGGRENLDREYTYLTEKGAEDFVKESVEAILSRLEEYFPEESGLCRKRNTV